MDIMFVMFIMNIMFMYITIIMYIIVHNVLWRTTTTTKLFQKKGANKLQLELL